MRAFGAPGIGVGLGDMVPSVFGQEKNKRNQLRSGDVGCLCT